MFPHELGLGVLDYLLATYQEDLHPSFKMKFVLESANVIFKNSMFTFYLEFNLQVKGPSVGTISASTYVKLWDIMKLNLLSTRVML